MQLEVGDVLFVHGSDTLSLGIEWFEHLAHGQEASCFSHVAVCVGSGQLIEAQGFRRHAVDTYPITEYPIVSVKRFGTPLSEVEQYALILAALKEMHDGYDYAEIVALALRYLWKWHIAFHARKRVECAELVIRLYDAIRQHLTNDPSPAGLWESPYLAYVGTYKTKNLIAP